MVQQRAVDINHSLSGYDSGWFGQIWCALEVLHFLPLTYSGEVMKMTWPEVTDIKNPRYFIKIVDTYVRIAHCEFRRVWICDPSLIGSQTLKKGNLGSGHLMRPGGVTFGVIGSSFFKCAKLLAEQLWQIWRAAVFSLSAKNLKGADNRPPPPRPCAG